MISCAVDFDENGDLSQTLSAMADNLADNFARDACVLLHSAAFAWALFDAHKSTDITDKFRAPQNALHVIKYRNFVLKDFPEANQCDPVAVVLPLQL